MKTRASLTFIAFALLAVPLLLAFGPPPTTSTRSSPAPACLCKAGPSALVRQVVQTAVMVDNNGSGTIIRLGGIRYVLTAAHVVAHAYPDGTGLTYVTEEGESVLAADKAPRKVAVEFKVGKTKATQEASIVWYDATTDLALLRPTDQANTPPPAYLAGKDTEVEPGEGAWYCGLGSGLPWNLVATIVNQADDQWLTVNGEGWYGHSGSGAFVVRDGRYRLVGVVVQGHNPRSPKCAIRCVTLVQVHKFLKAFEDRKK